MKTEITKKEIFYWILKAYKEFSDDECDCYDCYGCCGACKYLSDLDDYVRECLTEDEIKDILHE